MVGILSWMTVAVIAVLALVGFLGVAVTGVRLGVQSLASMRSPDRAALNAVVRTG
jgi:hypothetical protein